MAHSVQGVWANNQLCNSFLYIADQGFRALRCFTPESWLVSVGTLKVNAHISS